MNSLPLLFISNMNNRRQGFEPSLAEKCKQLLCHIGGSGPSMIGAKMERFFVIMDLSMSSRSIQSSALDRDNSFTR